MSVGTGCEPRTRSANPDTAGAGPDSDATGDGDADTAERAACPTDQRFADYAWIPDDTSAATLVELRDPRLEPALERLADLSQDPAQQLPIRVALDYRNLGMLLGNLERVLVELELAPAEIAQLHGPEGALIWVIPTGCDAAVLGARILDRLGVMLRADMEHPGLRTGAGTEAFPFDVLTLGEDQLVLTMAGQGARVGPWLHAARRDGTEVGAGPALDELDPAPLRSVWLGEALLTPGDAAPSLSPDSSARGQVIRVHADDAELRTLEPPAPASASPDPPP